jgi:hypothetical protein
MMQSVTYLASDEVFANPERGFSPTIYTPWPDAGAVWDFCGQGNNFTNYNYAVWTPKLDADTLRKYAARGSSMVEMRYHIFEFRQQALSQAFLDRVQEDFDTARANGYKLIPRFAYNWPKGGPDASRDQILAHLEQLRPVLTKNADVIAFMALGFIGCWGEQHTSSNGHTEISAGYSRITTSFRDIVEKALNVLPKDRMLMVRYPSYKFQYFNGAPQAQVVQDVTPIAPLTLAEAFTGTTKARWGHHDDCVICGEYNAGTWWTPRNNVQELRDFLRQDNLYVVQHGEPGNEGDGEANTVDKDGDGYAGLGNYKRCDRVQGIFQQARFSSFNGTYDNGGDDSEANRAWREQGCYDNISKKLGYRFELLRAQLPATAAVGGQLQGSIVLRNAGWAAPFNLRGLELILRNRGNGAVYRIDLRAEKSKSFDPRLWQPDDNEITLNIAKALPANAPAGSYELLLNLPDPSASLYARPQYAIRFANKDVWEATTGFNKLNATLEVR